MRKDLAALYHTAVRADNALQEEKEEWGNEVTSNGQEGLSATELDDIVAEDVEQEEGKQNRQVEMLNTTTQDVEQVAGHDDQHVHTSRLKCKCVVM